MYDFGCMLAMNRDPSWYSTMGMGMLNAYCLVVWAMVEVEHEKGTHTRACRMLHLNN